MKKEDEKIKMGNNNKDIDKDNLSEQIEIQGNFEQEEDLFSEVRESLKLQISEEMLRETGKSTGENDNDMNVEVTKKSKKRKVLKVFGAIVLFVVLVGAFFGLTPTGRKIIYDAVGGYVSGRLDNTEVEKEESKDLFAEKPIDTSVEVSDVRKEAHVANFLIMGLEEIDGGARSDAMMIASINIKDKSMKLVSLMRDCYVEIPGKSNNRLNAAFGSGGVELLIDTIELNFKVEIDGYASVNFESFEKIVDILGGVSIELGKTEASYLRTTNYISKPEFRTVTAGLQTLNGNQALGYSRVRKVVTLGGANNDYGRTLRQRRVLNAIFDKYKSKNLFELVSIMDQILPMIKTDLDGSEISQILEAIVENGIRDIDNFRIPANDMFKNVVNEVGDVLVLDFEANVKELHRILYLDDEGEITLTPVD